LLDADSFFGLICVPARMNQVCVALLDVTKTWEVFKNVGSKISIQIEYTLEKCSGIPTFKPELQNLR